MKRPSHATHRVMVRIYGVCPCAEKCPLCGSGKGNSCLTRTGYAAPFHSKRRKLVGIR